MVVKQRGFTLLELLVAMAILAMTGVTLMRVSSEHIRSVTYLEELSVASMIAENRGKRVKLTWPSASGNGCRRLWRQTIQTFGWFA